MTLEALLFIALNRCPTLDPSLARIMVGIAQHENPKLDPKLVHRNENGTSDYGLAQVNTINLGWTKLTNPFDPCANLTAGAKVLFARYNGNPPGPVKAKYATEVMARLASTPNHKPAARSSPHMFSRPERVGRDLLTSKTQHKRN